MKSAHTITLISTAMAVQVKRREFMFKETLTEHDDVIGLVCEGKLSEDDFERMHTLIHERLSQGGRPGLLLDTNDFSRVAVVGERSWMEWGTRMVNLLARSEMRWFDSSEEVDAVEWVQKGKKA